VKHGGTIPRKPYNAGGASGNLMSPIVSHKARARLKVNMNRVVRLGDLSVRQGVLAVVLLFSSVVLGQQPNTPGPSVPDAPTPQQPDSLGGLSSGVAPGKGSQAPAQDQGTNTTRCHPSTTTPGQGSSQDQQPQDTPPEVKSLQTFVTRVNYVLVPVTVLDKKHQQVPG
jgi:hypothetical protein